MLANLDGQLLAAGVSQQEIELMTNREKRDLLRAFADSSQPEVPSSDEDEFQRVLALSLSESQTVVPFVLSIGRPRRLAADDIAAAEGGHPDVASMERVRRNLVSGMARFGSLHRQSYSAEIQKMARALPAAPSADGIRVALLLPNGQRVARTFDRRQTAEDVYMWCAAADSMAKDFVRPGDFVIVTGDGTEFDPAAAIGEQVGEEDRVLLNVRVLPIEN
jgi:hypothetical protein